MAKEVYMTFTHLPKIAQFIRRTHESFAGCPVSDALGILGDMNASMMLFPAQVGASFEAMTDADHGSLATLVTVSRLPQGGWWYEERTMETAAKLGMV